MGKEQPEDELRIGRPGTAMNIAGEMLNAAGGIKATHVPYRGAGPAINDLLGGHIDFMAADVTVLLPPVRSNKMRAIALYAGERSPLVPDVLTAKEQGFPDLAMENWYGVLAPAGVPADVLTTLEIALDGRARPARRAKAARRRGHAWRQGSARIQGGP